MGKKKEKEVGLFQSFMQGISDKDETNSRNDSIIYYLRKSHDLFISDVKYKYESITVDTKKIGEQFNQVFHFNKQTNVAEYYDIVINNYLLRIDTSLGLITAVTNVRPKYILVNQTGQPMNV